MSGTIPGDHLQPSQTFMKHNRLIVGLFLLIIATSVQAQSGRRQVKAPSVAPVPTPTPEPAPTPKTEKEPDRVILVGTDRHSGPMTIPFSYYDAAQQGCAERLRGRSDAGVDVAQRDMHRGEAIEKAKKEQKTYVLLLSLKYDAMSSSNDDLLLEYTLFEPVTAKVISTGRSYLNAKRAGPLVVPTGRSPLYREQLLREAGEEVADRILKKLNLGTGPK